MQQLRSAIERASRGTHAVLPEDRLLNDNEDFWCQCVIPRPFRSRRQSEHGRTATVRLFQGFRRDQRQHPYKKTEPSSNMLCIDRTSMLRNRARKKPQTGNFFSAKWRPMRKRRAPSKTCWRPEIDRQREKKTTLQATPGQVSFLEKLCAGLAIERQP